MVIAFLSLLAVALLLDAVVQRLRARRRGAALAGWLLAAVLAFGVFEQTTAQDVPAVRGDARQWHSDGVFVARDPGAPAARRERVPAARTCRSRRAIRRHAGGRLGRDLRDQVRAAAGLPALVDAALELRRDQGPAGGLGRRSSPAGRCRSCCPAVTAAGLRRAVGRSGRVRAGDGAARVRSALRSLLGVQPLSAPIATCGSSTCVPYRARLERADSPAQLAALRARTLHPVGPVSPACVPGGARREPPGPGSLVVGLTGPSCPR